MIGATLDTNILVSATIATGNPLRILESAKDGKFILILSPAIIEEYTKVISRPKFRLNKEQIDGAIKLVVETSEIVLSDLRINRIREDLSDNRILECAISGKSDYIVSGDGHLLKIGHYRNVKIVTARKFLEILEK